MRPASQKAAGKSIVVSTRAPACVRRALFLSTALCFGAPFQCGSRDDRMPNLFIHGVIMLSCKSCVARRQVKCICFEKAPLSSAHLILLSLAALGGFFFFFFFSASRIVPIFYLAQTREHLTGMTAVSFCSCSVLPLACSECRRNLQVLQGMCVHMYRHFLPVHLVCPYSIFPSPF